MYGSRRLSLVAAMAALMIPGLALAQNVTTRVTLAPGKLDLSQLQMEGFEPSIVPGQPRLPRRVLEVALHPRADLSTLELRLEPGVVDTLPGTHVLAPNPPLRLVTTGGPVVLSWAGAGTVLGGKDLDAYGSQGIFPAAPVTRLDVTNRRGMLVLRLVHTPLRYRHSTGELLLDRHTAVQVRYKLRSGGSGSGAFEPDPQILSHLKPLLNAAEAEKWYGATRADVGTPKTGYAIFIPDALAKASKRLSAFIAHKKSLGFEVRVVDEAALAAMPATEKGGDAERMRLWLQRNYKTLNIKYALLIGNPDPRRKGVPMKLTYAMATHHNYPTKTPSDYYYADLTGNWDLDKDGQVAEYPDDNGQGGVDWVPEVYVGRIPIYSNDARALDQVLDKTMAYISDRGDRSWRMRVLQPAAMLFYKNQYGQNHVRIDGADMARAIWDQVIKKTGLTRTTLYEADGVDPSKLSSDLKLTRDNVVKEWNKGYGLVTWFGHGSSAGVYRTIWTKDDGDQIPEGGKAAEISSPAFFTYDDVMKLDDSRPAFVFHGSCSNGYPESADNIGYGLLLHGAIGTVSSSRVAVVVITTGSASAANIFGVEREFTRQLLDNKPAGVALLEAKRKISDELGMMTWFTRLEINLYGDPSVSLTSCSVSSDCDDGLRCNGKETCKAGQCLAGAPIRCQSSDPCGDSVCDENLGGCKVVPRAEGTACDDGKFCTIGDTCVAGHCSGVARCDISANPCLTSTCDETGRTCKVATAAFEGKVCRAGTSREGTCLSGLCQPDTSGCAVAPAGGAGGSLPGPPLLLLALLALGALWLRRRR
jgi:MYXO-CTERM domain-containing protein